MILATGIFGRASVYSPLGKGVNGPIAIGGEGRVSQLFLELERNPMDSEKSGLDFFLHPEVGNP